MECWCRQLCNHWNTWQSCALPKVSPDHCVFNPSWPHSLFRCTTNPSNDTLFDNGCHQRNRHKIRARSLNTRQYANNSNIIAFTQGSYHWQIRHRWEKFRRVVEIITECPRKNYRLDKDRFRWHKARWSHDDVSDRCFHSPLEIQSRINPRPAVPLHQSLPTMLTIGIQYCSTQVHSDYEANLFECWFER